MWLTPELKEHLIYWKNPRDSGIAFGSVLVILLAVKYVSIISVVANLALALITSTMAFRIYKSVLSAVNKSHDGHPFKVCLSFFIGVDVMSDRKKIYSHVIGQLGTHMILQELFCFGSSGRRAS